MVKASHRKNKPLWDFQIEGLIPPKLEKIGVFFGSCQYIQTECRDN